MSTEGFVETPVSKAWRFVTGWADEPLGPGVRPWAEKSKEGRSHSPELLLMVQKSQGQPPFGCQKLVNNGIDYQPQLVLAGFLPSTAGGGFNHFCFHPYLGRWSILTNIFPLVWNHQLRRYSIFHLFRPGKKSKDTDIAGATRRNESEELDSCKKTWKTYETMAISVALVKKHRRNTW